MLPFERIVVVGAGLIGGSVALGLRRAGVTTPIDAFEPSPAGAVEARATGAFACVRQKPLAPEDIADGDLVVLAAPVAAIVSTLGRLGDLGCRDVIVTDCGSTKRTVVAVAAALGGQFVGGHPMAGSEVPGAGAAREDLFDGAVWAVVGEDGEPMTRVMDFVRLLGAEPVRMGAEAHDRHVARVSHLPQLLSCALAKVAGGVDGPFGGGPGLASMTRLADSSWSIWRDIIEANADAIEPPLDELIEVLTRIRETLARGESPELASLFNK
jgi:prephenate dehydrogenase